MKIGFLTACLPECSFNDVIDFASKQGFETSEVACWPGKNERDFSSNAINVAKLDKKIYAPGESGTIKVTFTAKITQNGPTKQAIYIHSNDKKNPRFPE